MLQDRDRIFTNLYGLHSPGLEGARRRGRLGRHQVPARQGPRLDRRRDEEVGPARARRRRLPDRPQVVVHAEAVGRAAALPRRQRRRIRARHLQGPGDHAARSAPPGRRLPDRLVRDGRARLLHLHPRRVHRRARARCSAPSTRPTRRSSSARTTSTAIPSTSTSTTAPAPISAARRRRCSRASKARRACRA